MDTGVTRMRRRPRAWTLACILLAAALVAASPPARASFQSVNIVITTDKASYVVGDDVNVTVRVFSFAVPSDPSSVLMQLNPGFPQNQTANLTRQGVGLYNATFPVNATNVVAYGGGGGFIEVQASATVGSLTDVESVSVLVAPSTVVGLTLTPSSFTATPGTAVHFALLTTVDRVPRNASSVVTSAFASTAQGFVGALSLLVSNVSTGNYSAVLQIPTDLGTPALLTVLATATIAGMNVSRFAFISIPGPQPFDIWAYQISFQPPVADFVLFVGDTAGGFVNGANVTLNYTIYSYSPVGIVVRAALAATDVYGRAYFSLDLGGATQVLDVMYRGNVTKGTDRQAFSGVLFTPNSNHAVFQISRSNPYSFFDLNTTAQLNYSVTAMGTPVSGARVYYYAQTPTEFLAAGNATSDGNGAVTLTIPMRGPFLQILLTAQTGPSSWYTATDYVSAVHPLEVQTGPIRIGTAVQVNVTFPYAGTWLAGATLLPYVSYTGTSPWSAVSNFYGSGALTPTGAGVSYSLTLPRFLPKDADYLLYVSVTPAAALTSGTAFEPYAYTRIVHIPNLVPQVRENLSTTSPAVGDVLTADASTSYDSDGFIVGYRMSWGDGNVTDWGGSPVFTHTFAAPGDYKVSMSVMDDTGAVAITQQMVHVEATVLGLRVSLALPLFVAIAAVAVVIVGVLWWRRRKRPTSTPPAAETATVAPEGPSEPGPPPSAP